MVPSELHDDFELSRQQLLIGTQRYIRLWMTHPAQLLGFVSHLNFHFFIKLTNGTTRKRVRFQKDVGDGAAWLHPDLKQSRGKLSLIIGQLRTTTGGGTQTQ